MTRMEKYIRDHPFFAHQSVFKFSTTQRRAFERDVYDQARALNYSKANAKKQVITARHLCGEKDYDSDDSKLGDEIDDSEVVLIRKPGQVTNQVYEALDQALTKKRKLERTKDGASEDDRPSKKNKKGNLVNQGGTENEITSSTFLSLTKNPPETIPIKDLRIRVVVSMITAMVEIIEAHIECDCKSQNSIGGNTQKLDDHGEHIIEPSLTQRQWLKLRKELLRPFDFQRLRDDMHLHKAVMDLFQEKKKTRDKLMVAWRIALSHGVRSHGARNKYERSFHDTIGGPDDFCALLCLAGFNAGTLKQVDDEVEDAVRPEPSTAVADVSHEVPAKEPKKRKKQKKKTKERPDDINPKKGVVIDPSIGPLNNIGVHEAQQASLGKGNTKLNESALVALPPSGSKEHQKAAEKAERKARKKERKARKKELRERDRQKLVGASTNAGDPKNQSISHNKEDELLDLAGIINGLHSASLKQEEPQDIMEKPSVVTTLHEHPSHELQVSTAKQGNLYPEPHEIIEISSNSPSPPQEQPKKWTKDQKHKALQADSWLVYTGDSADGFPDRLEATFKDLEHNRGLKFTHEEQLRIQDMLQANYGDSYSGSDLQDQILGRIAATQSRDEMIPPVPKKPKGKEKEKEKIRAKSISRKSDFQSPMIR